MEGKEQPNVIISLDDTSKDNQENQYSGSSGGNTPRMMIDGGVGGGNNRDSGPGNYRRKNYYYNSNHRYRQGHNPHHYNNGYNNSYNNGYNNGYYNHSNYGGGRNRGNNDHKHYYSYPPTDHHNHGHIHCHNDSRAQYEPYQQHQHRDGPYDIYSPGSQYQQFTNFFHPGHNPQHLQGTGGQLPPPVFPPPQYIFPEIQHGISDQKNSTNVPHGRRNSDWNFDKESTGSNGENSLPSLNISVSSCDSPGPGSNYQNVQGNYGRRSSGSSNTQNGKSYYANATNRWHWNPNSSDRIEEMMEKYHYVYESERPKELAPTPGHDFARLSEQIWGKFQANQQTLETFRMKLELWKDLVRCVRRYNTSYQLEVVGSTLSGFGSNSSDVDMCLILNYSNESDPRAEAIEILENLSPIFESIPSLRKTELILAKVPILKLREMSKDIDIDINVNNSVGLRNTHLLHAYAEADWRVRPLVVVVKLWAQAQGINDAKMMTLSSYSLVLMVIHFLQSGVSPEILPCLQVEFPDKFTQVAQLWRVRKMITDPVTLNKSENMQTLGELMIGFLEYFAVKFDYKSSAISVRSGSVVSAKSCAMNRALKNDAYQWKHICIEEPFEYTNTARSVYDKDAFDRIRGTFIIAWQRLKTSHDLDTIFQTISPMEARRVGGRVVESL